MIKIVILFILFAVSPAAGFFAFADQPGSAPDDKSSAQIPPIPSASDTAAADTHSSYLYDLKKLIDRSRENIKEVNERIKEQAVLKRNQKREERAHEYYEKGVALTNEGKFDEARDYFEKAQTLWRLGFFSFVASGGHAGLGTRSAWRYPAAQCGVVALAGAGWRHSPPSSRAA